MRGPAAALAARVPRFERRAERGAVVAGGGLDEHVLERRVLPDLAVGDAVHRAAAGEAEASDRHARVHAAQHVKRGVFEHALHRRGEILVRATSTGSSGRRAGPEQIDQPVGVDIRDGRLARIPAHRDLAGPMAEVVEVEREAAAGRRA